MKVQVDITTDLPANVAGEILLMLINPSKRWGYSTTDIVVPGFEVVNEVPSLPVRTLMCGFVAKIPEEYSRIQWFRKENLNVYLYWDGDGCVVFEFDGNFLVNSDIKCDYGWEWNPDWINDLPKGYYEEET